MNAVVYGVGTSDFGKQRETTASDLAWTALSEVFDDAGVAAVDAIYVGSVFGEMGVAQRALHPFGLHDVPVIRVENACASGTTAFHEANAAITVGRYERVLVLGLEHMSRRVAGALPPEPRDPHGRAGLVLPALYAMAATRYMHDYGVTREQLAAVSVKNHAHALDNRRAQYGMRLTIGEVLASRPIADPLTLLQCSPVSDGAAAAILGPPRGGPRDVRVVACAMGSGGIWDHRSASVWGFQIVRDVARRAYELAGVEPDDIDLVECHDAFTIGEIVTCEALGLADQGKGAWLAASGETTLGGRVVVNPSGGLLSRGHPLGATGVAQVAEVVTQLRHEAGPRQVDDAEIGLVETMGGGVTGIDGNGCVVAVLRR